MKQKYLISSNDEKNKLTIKEFAELEKQDEYTLLCEEKYSGEAVESAVTKGKQALISTLRTTNLYPPALYAEKIAVVIMRLFSSESDQSVELFFDDKDFFQKNWKSLKMWMISKVNRANLMKCLNKSQRNLMGCLKIIIR